MAQRTDTAPNLFNNKRAHLVVRLVAIKPDVEDPFARMGRVRALESLLQWCLAFVYRRNTKQLQIKHSVHRVIVQEMIRDGNEEERGHDR